MSDHGQQQTSEKSTGKEPQSKPEISTDTEINVWHIPPVKQQLRALQNEVDKDELRAGCYEESLITPAQRNHLAAINDPFSHNTKLVQFLEAGHVFSFNGFIKVLTKNLPRAQRHHYERLSQAALAYVGHIQYAEQVQCLVRVKDGENGAPAQLEVDKAAVKELEARYLFVRQYGSKVQIDEVDDNATGAVQDSLTAQESNTNTTNVPKVLADQPGDNPLPVSTDSPETKKSGSRQGQNADLNTPDEEELLAKWLKEDNTVEKESRIMGERLSRRIVLLAGDFDIIVKDLSSRGVATQKNLAKLTTNAEESGIYCLTPADKTKPIYMILKLKRQAAGFHTRILRLALEMSRHLVVYHGETKLMAGKYFNPSQAQQRPGASRTVSTSSGSSTVHRRDTKKQTICSLDLDDRSVDILKILHSVLETCPLTSRIDLNHRSVHLYCVLDVPHEAAQHVLHRQCVDYCKELFKTSPGHIPRPPVLLPHTPCSQRIHPHKCGVSSHSKPASKDLGHIPRPPVLKEPTIQFSPDFNVTEAHCFGQQVKVASRDPDPWVDQMWLHSMCGLIPRPLLTCIMTGAGDGRCELVTEDSRALMDRQESSNKDDVEKVKMDGINFGLLERVLLSWNGAVQISTILAGKDDKWTQDFLLRQAGLPFFSSTGDQKAVPSVMVAWRFSQALNLLRLFLVFTDPIPTVVPAIGSASSRDPRDPSAPSQLDEAHRRMSRLVYASTAVSNICILPESSGEAGTQGMLQMYMECLNSVAGKHLESYKVVNKGREEEILSGTLLVSGDHGKVTAKALTDRYLGKVIYLDQSLESAADELLSSHSQQQMYASGPRCLDIMKLIVISINEERFNDLTLQDLYLTEYKSEIRKLNYVARHGKPASGSWDKSVQKGKELAFTVEIGWKFALSVSGYETMSNENFMKVERRLQKPRCVDAGDQDATVRIDLRKSQLVHHRKLVKTQDKTDKLCQAVLEKHGSEMDERIEVVNEWVKENINGINLGKVFGAALVAECKRYIKGMKESKQLCLHPCSYDCDYPCLLPAGHPSSEDTEAEDNGPRGDLASEGTSADSKDLSSLAAEYAPRKHDCHPTSDETEAEDYGPRGNLASGGASAVSEDSSSLAAEYAPRMHDCLLCDRKNERQHKCNHGCELCEIDLKEDEMDGRKTECYFKPGHQLDGIDDENIHLCMTREELDSKGKHRCKQLCAMAKARGCKQQCQELKMIPRAGPETSHDICDCLIGKEKHLCDEQCNLCDKRCERVYKHPGSEAHNCGNVHNCAYLCEEKGVCAVDMQQPEDGCTPVKQNLRSSNGWKRPCKKPIPKWESAHDGLHSCVEPGGKSSHTCEATCRWCTYFCEEPFGHHDAGSLCATTNHGPVIHSTDRIKLCKGDTVKVDELARREWTPCQDSGVVPESPTTCSTLCSKAGPRHIHLVSTANGRYTEVKHSDFWKEEMAFNDPSQGHPPDFVRLFDRCPIRCWEEGHDEEDTEEVFCVEDALHVPLVPMQDDNQTEGGRDFQYTSTAVGFDSKGILRVAGHRFKCGLQHFCKAECKFVHSQTFLKRLFDFLPEALTREHIPCHEFVGHTGTCECEDKSYHVCGEDCDADACKKPCQVLKKPGSDGESHRHTCVTDEEKDKCRVVCEAVYCSISRKYMDKDTHAKRQCQRRCTKTPCRRECDSTDHFHLQGSGQHSGHHHICDDHPCGEPCHLGRCNGTPYGMAGCCVVPLDGQFKHGDPHLCSTPAADHGCSETCTYHDGCEQPCGHKLLHDATSRPHNCGRHKCEKPCELGRCSLDDVPGKCAIRLVTNFEHEEKHTCANPPDQHYCKETCQLCTGKCANTVGHPGTPHVHNCGTHKCEEPCSRGRCTEESNAPGKCGQSLTGGFKHKGKPHHCEKHVSSHFCPKQCQYTAGQSQCPKVCSRKMPHTSTKDHPHNCGTHKCEELCSQGRCIMESAELRRCKVKLANNFEHADVAHSCLTRSPHYCPEQCQRTSDQTQCETLCSKLMSATHDVHSCGACRKYPCQKPCGKGRCSSDSDERKECTEPFGHVGLCRCSQFSDHWCEEKCVGCQSGLPLSAGKEASPGQWCTKKSNHRQGRGTPRLHDCQKHPCKERCQSKFRCSEDAKPEDEPKMCARELVEVRGGRYGHASNPGLHECKKLADHLCNHRCKKTPNCTNYCSRKNDHWNVFNSHECSGCIPAAPGVDDDDDVDHNQQTPSPSRQEDQSATGKNSDTTMHLNSGTASGVGSVNVNGSQQTPTPPSQGDQSAAGNESDTPV